MAIRAPGGANNRDPCVEFYTNVPNSKFDVNLCSLLVADQVKPGCLCLGQLLLQQNHRLVQCRHLVQLPSKRGILAEGPRLRTKATCDHMIDYILFLAIFFLVQMYIDLIERVEFLFTSRLWGGSLQDSTSGRWLLFFSLV